jgi:hypothetical protein
MPNPTDLERLGNSQERANNLLETALDTTKAKMSWSEWFGGGSWLGQQLTDRAMALAVGPGGAALAGAALLAAVGLSGGWVILVLPGIQMGLEVYNDKLEDKVKELLPQAVQEAKKAIAVRLGGAGGDPSVILDAPIKKMLNGKEEVYSLEETIERIKMNTALIQDLLNRLAGKAGKPYFCDDAYQIAALAYKCDATKGELKRDVTLLQEFLSRLERDIDGIDHAKIIEEAKNVATQICEKSDGRHWDNTWSSATVKRAVRCSKEHCFGPRS